MLSTHFNLLHLQFNLHHDTYTIDDKLDCWLNALNRRYSQRIKGTTISANCISLLERFTLSATLSHNHQIYSQFNLIENPTKAQTSSKSYRYVSCEYFLPRKISHIFQFKALKRTTHSKMKDLINGNLKKVSSDLILDQKIAYNNGISNGDR